ncbi:MAG: phosphoglycerate mutase (2,3-diphosphoglycerate-independent) [Candidatus Magasanikbacteria bacterium RIFCSPLOWO2_01_FULL_43_20b]|uniref:2,3-bisphosphoglycerate-independent phosphoglycerate mutase n=1 Tax=Candidatus Magasanikbacteria bacterium RIFCSPLOWO2_12_FULL_43_12 TaxID=1798692 RepID=A0A1F6MRJ4_9BACT|nr:MAG: phosphoglycerate mutase (2,3-diphosphoglycerate-independent) [Candidatus Magasanikbacteria bacterium RIFCSPHIGHO2_02_FULL_44_13]OGH72156.1 MAG: phosphoglycerate mutase (2,3-diphosphoglycerate-independent) [Candidatus Magasanikbacteria bacterium RIFCSPLOWO2_02_FULL_43_22]OGH73467.1 MAG: phosphoglycerate mutase (2,3-diphosphoglycerate-independent) [Candidatus Magasanikbacteria bacterium RIFCSPLOWO2_01_FULL_43_20b]OGH74262.1 MAG: phosphoglycerate mutase (2,3-diphosphoglycerate-independent) 
MSKTNHNHRPTMLIILDGFGLADAKNSGNAITAETAPNIFGYLKKYPNSTLKTYGEYVGLAPGQQGNSEAGHLNIGAGRIVKQDLVRISEAIHEGTFFKNEAFKQALFHVKKYKTAIHIIGLLTDGNSAHACPEHFHAMLEYFRREGQKKVFLHLITDGRDSSPHGATNFLHELRGHMLAHEKIATIMGRFYAMDRNKIWERTQRAYEAMVMGKGCAAPSAEEGLAQSYNRGDTDEYICPTIIVENNKKPIATIKDNDAVFFINSRSDRARQITKAFVQKDFEKHNPGAFKRVKQPKNIRFVAMTDFGPDLEGLFTAFPSPDIGNCLPAVIDDNYRQLYISETEKYAHITYFINGGYADPLNGETREVIKSLPTHSYAEHPEMSAIKLSKKIASYLQDDKYNFICVNFPNSDMLGHTGDFKAAQKAIQVVDKAVGEIISTLLKKNGQALIIADHGNAEEMINLKTGEIMTEHTVNPVPCILVSKDPSALPKAGKKISDGILADIAPTLLKMMGLKKPREMTGKSLI